MVEREEGGSVTNGVSITHSGQAGRRFLNQNGLSRTIVDRRPRQVRRKSSARRSVFAAVPKSRTEITWPPGGTWFETSTPCRTPMSGPPHRRNALRILALLEVARQ